jgi:hypothetical protein
VSAGGCECGAVRYRLTAAPILVNCCHCRDCQTITGSAFALNAVIETAAVVVDGGEPVEVALPRGEAVTRAWRCGRCWTLLWADHPQAGDRLRFVRVGTLDAAERYPASAHFFVRSRHPWVGLPAGVPAFETLPPDGWGVPLDAGQRQRIAAATAETRPA